MQSSFKIAFPTLDDVPAMAALHVKCWQQAYRGIFPDSVLNNLSVEKRVEGWTRTLNDPHVFSPAAQVGGVWCGFMHCGPTRQKYGEGEVYGIYVDSTQYRRGVGRRLMTLASDNLSGRGYRSFVLCVVENNHRARRFYETMGGTLTDEKLSFTLEGIDYPEVMYEFKL
jgi:ribosomal protein S18 acetylase RimI-like enzyme